MRNSFWPRLGCLFAACLAVTVAWGYDVIRKEQDAALVTYDPGSIPIQVKLGTDVTLEDGTNFSTSTLTAMTDWNPEIGAVQFAGTILEAGPGADGDNVNQIFFSDTIYGEAFGENTLAVTLSWVMVAPRPDGTYQRTQSDILFNTAKTWNSYRGAHRYGGPYDIRRVAIHELGHVLGLDHPDEAVPPQSVTAIMNSTISNIDAIKPDDRAGAQYLYGPGTGTVTRPANDDFAAAYAVNLVNNAFTWSANNYGGTKESGEPNHAPDEPGGTSVWWKWTAPGNGSMTVTTAGSYFDTMLAAYTGSAVNALSQIASNDDVQSGVVRTSTITFATTAGTTYYIAVDGWEAETGLITLNLNFTPEVVNAAPVITSHPANRGVSAGQSAQFTVSAVGTPTPTYRWQRLPAGAGTWSDLYDGGNYSGTGSTTLTVSSATAVMNGDQFRCVASNVAGSATSNAAVLTLYVAPLITTQPVNQSVVSGSAVTFIAEASGTPAPTYQWQKEGVNINGATGSSYTIASVSMGDAATYRVVATNPAGTATSNGAVLSVIPPGPIITNLSPVRQVFVPGQNLNLSVSATGTGAIAYQWIHNGRVIDGATGATLNRSDLQASDSGWYLVLLTDNNGTRRSAPMFVAVGPALTQVRRWGNSTTVPSGLTNVLAVANSVFTGLALKADGTLIGWHYGSDPYGLTTPPGGLAEVVSVASGDYHSLALKSDGTVVAWGDNYYGNVTVPSGLSNVVAISAGGHHSLVLKSDGTLASWGNNNSGAVTIPAGVTEVVAISAGNAYTVVVKRDGSVAAWGYNDQGQTSVPSGLGNVVAVAAGGAHVLALKGDGTVVAWGKNDYGQATVPANLDNVIRIAAGPSHSLALRANGTVVAWGRDWDGVTAVPADLVNVIGIAAGPYSNLALRDATGETAPIITVQPTSLSVALGQQATFAVEATGAGTYAYQWRKNGIDIPGATNATYAIVESSLTDAGNYDVVITNYIGSTTSSLAVLTVNIAPVITSISPPRHVLNPGQSLNLSVTATGAGTLSYQWTRNGRPIYGANNSNYSVSNVTFDDAGWYLAYVTDNNGTKRSSPIFVTIAPNGTLAPKRQVRNFDLNGVDPPNFIDGLAVASGYMHSLMLRSDGTVFGWGNNDYGQITVPADLVDAVAIAAGHNYSLALRSDGTVRGWGDFANALAPPAGLAEVVALATGGSHSLALKSDGTVVAWGTSNYYGQLSVPTGLADVVAISAHGGYSLALKSNGTVIGWGQLSSTYAVVPANLTNVIAIAIGETRAMALRDDGTVVEWGYYPHYEYDYRPTTVMPAGLNGIVAIAAGYAQSLAIKTDGSVIGWGATPVEQQASYSVLSKALSAAIGRYSYVVLRDASADSAPEVSVTPASQTLLEDQTTSFTAIVSGAGPWTYQWRKDGNNIQGATTSTYTIPKLTFADTGQYDVMVSNLVGTTTSEPAILTVIPLPLITYLSPVRQIIAPGEDLHLNISAAGTDTLSYQWYHNGLPVSGATNPSFTTLTSTSRANGWYYVLVSDSNGTRRSAPFFVKIAPPVTQIRTVGSPAATELTSIPANLNDVVEISAKFGHALALKSDGTIVAWGANYYGQAGVPTDLNEVVAVSAGNEKSIILKADGRVYIWGNNWGGFPILTDVVAISAGYSHYLALTIDGKVHAWGTNNNGVLNVPPGLTGVIAIAAGYNYSLALKNDGTLVIWGQNQYNGVRLPAGLSDIASISGGSFNTLAIKNDGTVVGWSYYHAGTYTVPAGLIDPIAIAAGSDSLAVRSDGSLLGWNGIVMQSIVIPPDIDKVFGAAAGYALFVLRDAGADTPPVMTSQPVSQALVDGQSAALSVQATGGGPYSYQWRKDGVAISGANAASLDFGNVQFSDAGDYDVMVTNHRGSTTSAAATLTVNPAPVISNLSPSNQWLVAGQPMNLAVTASGTGAIGYQWSRNGQSIPGATGAIYSLSSTNLQDSGWYTVAVTDSNGTRFSAPITVKVVPMATQVIGWGSNGFYAHVVPGNLNNAVSVDASFSHALALQRNGTVVAWGSNNRWQLDVPVGLSDVVAIAAGTNHSLALKRDGTVVAWGESNDGVTTVPSGLSDVIAIDAGGDHSLALKGNGTVVAWGKNVVGESSVPSSLYNVVSVAAGADFSLALRRDGTVVGWGNTTVPAGLTDVIAISASNLHALVLKRDGTVVTWGAHPSSQADVPVGMANVAIIAAAWETSMAVKKDCTLSVWGTTANSYPPYPGNITNCLAVAGGWNFWLALTDQTPASAPVITTHPANQESPYGADVVFRVTAYATGLLTYQWQVLPFGGDVWLNVSNDASHDGATAVNLLVSGSTLANTGDLYRCIVTNGVGSVTSNSAQLVFTNPVPVITSHPVSQGTLAGLPVAFYVIAVSQTPLIYQWQKDGVDIPGAISDTFSIPVFQINDVGNYRVVVSNGIGSVISNSASLAVAVPPTITSQPQGQNVYSGMEATFSVSATSNATMSYVWWKDGVIIPGANQPAFSIPVTMIADAGDYSVGVSNVAGSVTSQVATLVVNASSAPSIAIQPQNRAIVVGGIANFTVSATGAPSPAYQWEVKHLGDGNWGNIGFGMSSHSGALTNSLTITGATIAGNNGDLYRCVVSNVAGTITSQVATLTVGLPGFTKLSAGRYHSLRLDLTSQAFMTGTNTYGQLGDGTTTNVTTPKQLTLPGQTVTDVAAGAEHSLFLTSSGQVWAAGFNATGQLGDGTNAAKSTPALLTTNATGIAAGRFHSAVLKSDGTLWTTGGNDSGQLGNGTTTDTNTLAQVATDVIELAAGIRQTFFLKSDGTLWGMGDMNGSGTPVSTPVQLATNVKAVTAGGYHSLFLKTDGTLWALGYNPFGQLGTADTTDRTSPVQVATGVKAIATGYFHSAFIKTDDSLWLMGYNSSGQLGDGTTTNRPTPFQLATNVAAVTASEAYTLYSKNDGSLWGTGYNAYGQFGNGGTAVTASPVQIATGVIFAPEAPTGLTATPSVSFDRVRLLWTPQGSAASYEVWRHSANNSANATLLASGLRWPLFEDRSVALGQAYYYWIKAVNSAGSTLSAPANASTGASLSQTITFTGPLDQPYTATPLTLSATASSGLPVSFSLLSGPATLTGAQLTLTGVGTVTVRASQAGDAGYDSAPDVDRTFTVSANFDSWELGHFTAPELTDANVSGPHADPDGDGLANLIEYALGLEPRTSSTTGLPEVTTDATHWIYTYARPEGRTDVTIAVEVSTDLSGWGAPTVAEVLVSTSGGVETWQAKQPLTSANAFFRLKVSQ